MPSSACKKSEARIDLVVALRDRRFIVPAQTVTEGQRITPAPVVRHEDAIVAIAIGQRRIFFFNDTAPTEIYTLSLHDALPIYCSGPTRGSQARPQITIGNCGPVQ